MAKLFDGKCINPDCKLTDEVVEDIWGETVHPDTKKILGSVCDCCNREVQHVLAGIRFIDKSGGDNGGNKAGQTVFKELREEPGQTPFQEGDFIVEIGEKVTNPDGTTEQSITAGRIEKILYRKKTNSDPLN